MRTRTLGPFTVSAIGLGAMPMSMNDDGRMPDERASIATIHAALDAGVTLIDTADIYAPSWDTMGHNEALVGKAVRSYGGSTDSLVIATKGGITRAEGEQWGRDGSLPTCERPWRGPCEHCRSRSSICTSGTVPTVGRSTAR